MKSAKCQLLFIIIIISSISVNAQNVGIGTLTPAYKFTVNPGTNNWGIVHTDGNVMIGSYIYSSGIGEFGTRSNHPFYLFANNSDAPPAIAIEKNGVNVGIYNTNPVYNLDIHSAGNAQLNLQGSNGQTALFSRYSNRLEIQPSDAFEISIGGIDQRNLCIGTNGDVGIGNATPANQLEIGIAKGFSGNNLAMGNGTQGMSFYQSTTSSTWYSNTSFALMPNTGNGYVGIGIQSPANKLQIGSIGSSGFTANDIAFGNGTQASAIAQTASTAWWYSNTDIALMPHGNGHGRVGINTTSPQCPLEVDDNATVFGTGFGEEVGDTIYTGSIPLVAILANGKIVGSDFYTFSDARIKNIKDISNSKEDLEILNKIQITDYTMKDKIANGNKTFKKVIAQQVEEVDSQLINKTVNYIPNVYQFTTNIQETLNGFLLTFKNTHHLTSDAKMIQLMDKEGTKRYEIISIPSSNQVIIKAENLKGDKVFVYGQQVNDFRTVDYDGLTTLNISATQELSKLVTKQQKEIELLAAEIKQLKKGKIAHK